MQHLFVFNIIPIFAVAFALTCALTPFAKWLAPRVGAIDMPKARGMHDKPMPRFGGVAIFLGSTIAMLLFLPLWKDRAVGADLLAQDSRLWGLLGAGLLIFLVGVVDDIKGVTPKQKLIGQLAGAAILFASGIRITFIGNPFGTGYIYFPGVISFLITAIWVVGITNTINLMDGLDGLAAGISTISSLCIAYVSYIHGWYTMCLILLALAGGASGFLPWNFHPAKIFMGDSGALYIGFMLAATTLLSPAKGATVFAILTPILVLALPIFDTLFAIVRRAAHRQPITVADKGHLHHRIMAVGMGQKRTVLTLYSICGTLGVSGITASRGLYVETALLMVFAFLLVYVFIDDTKPSQTGEKKKEEKKEETR